MATKIWLTTSPVTSSSKCMVVPMTSTSQKITTVGWPQDLLPLMTQHQITPMGVIHVGAHKGQELPFYQGAGFNPIVLIEPNPTLIEELRLLESARVIVIPVAIAAQASRETSLYVTKNDQASSIFEPLEHEIVEEVMIETAPLSDLDWYGVMMWSVNVLVIDAQGAELSVLASGSLSPYELIIVEVSDKVRYRGGVDRTAVESYLLGQNYLLIAEYRHGDFGISDLAFKQRQL